MILFLPQIVVLIAAYFGYPARVAAGVVALICIAKPLRQQMRRPPVVVSVALGVLVAIAWHFLAPPEVEPAVGWPLRVLGYVVVTPLIEEAAFRGFLIPWLEREGVSVLAAGAISAIGFGVMHGAILAGVIAGCAYVIAYRRGGLAASVLAHATTNAALLVLN